MVRYTVSTLSLVQFRLVFPVFLVSASSPRGNLSVSILKEGPELRKLDG